MYNSEVEVKVYLLILNFSLILWPADSGIIATQGNL